MLHEGAAQVVERHRQQEAIVEGLRKRHRLLVSPTCFLGLAEPIESDSEVGEGEDVPPLVAGLREQRHGFLEQGLLVLVPLRELGQPVGGEERLRT